ncbi:hypothetical protein Tco_1288679, partial [Tanacetum coccineum]
LRATYDAELVSAASLVNTARPTLSAARLGKFDAVRQIGAARQIWCYQGKVYAVCYRYYFYQSLILSQSIISHILIRVSMANLEFVDQHNMVACLEKTEGNSDFHELVDFLASSLIHHALTVSPTIYTSYIEQFWNTASSQTVNDVKQINATVDSKALVVTEASIRRSLLFNDADGTACLTNEAIFQNLALMGYEEPEPAKKMTRIDFDAAQIARDAEIARQLQEYTIKERAPPETSSSHATTQDSRDSLEGTNGNEGDQVQIPHDSPLSGGHTSDRAEGALNLQELSVLCTNLSNRVLALESIKDAQAAEISALKSRIKKLEKKCKPSISHHMAWLKREEKSKPESTLDDSTIFDEKDADHGMEYMEIEEVVDEGRQSGETEEVKLTDDTEVVKDKSSGDKGRNAEELVSTARPEVSTARPDIDAARQEDSAVEPRTPPTTTSIFDDEDITMAQTLIKMKEEKAKEKGVSIKDVDDSSRPERSILTLKPLPTIDPKDKGKGVLKESPVKKVKRSDLDAAQIAKDAEIARLVHEKELAEMEREREERQRQDQASVDYIASLYDEVQAKMDASEELAARLQMEERERYFMPIGSKRDEKMIDKMNKKVASMDEEEVPESTKVEVKKEGHEENIRKISRDLKMKATKKSKMQKTDSDLEEEEQLRAYLKIVPDEEEEIDYEVLGIRRRIDKEDKLWQNQERWNLKSWDLYENCGVHTLILEDGTEIHMLAERKYPLIKETLERMLSLRLVARTVSEDAYTLLRFIQKQIDEFRNQDGSEKDL